MIEIFEPYIICNKIFYKVSINNTLYEFFIEYNINENLNLNKNIDGLVILLSSVAICNNWIIKSKLPIDKLLYNNLKKLPEIYKKYHHKHTSLLSMIKFEDIKLELDLPTIIRDKRLSTINLTSLSMGIDSLHTILTNMQDLSHLFYVNKMDLSYTVKNFDKILYETSKKYNKKLITITSNIKSELYKLKLNENTKMPGTNWAVFTSDAMMVAFTYPLGINTLYLNGFGVKNFPCLNGQHYELGECFISNVYKLVNNLAPRIKKIKEIIENDLDVLKNLRVCNEWSDNKYKNCSKCQKCIKTVLYFYMLGKFDIIKPYFDINYEQIILYLNLINEKRELSLSGNYFQQILQSYYQLFMENSFLFPIIDLYDGDFINENYILKKT